MSTRVIIPDRRYVPMLTAAGLDSFDDFVSLRAGEVIARSPSRSTRRLRLGGDDGVVCFLKHYHAQRRPRLVPDKATVEARNYDVLRRRCGVSVPEVIAYGRRTLGPLWSEAFILTRSIDGAEPLDAYVSRRWPDARAAARDAEHSELLKLSADMVSRIHAAGFFHIDLQWRNVLVTTDGAGHVELHLLDSARGSLRRSAVMREHGRLRDLSSLSKGAASRLTPREQVRWLRRYYGVRRLSPAHRAAVRTILYDRAIKRGES